MDALLLKLVEFRQLFKNTLGLGNSMRLSEERGGSQGTVALLLQEIGALLSMQPLRSRVIISYFYCINRPSDTF
jgi:hypothetical protein